jgi:hypothetical protein
MSETNGLDTTQNDDDNKALTEIMYLLLQGHHEISNFSPNFSRRFFSAWI